MRIILCEDNKSDLKLLERHCRQYALERAGDITVIPVSTVEELLEEGLNHRDDVLFLDIYLEEESGIDAAQLLRRQGFTGDIILETVSSEHYAHGYSIEAIHYLKKPISYEAFCEAMRRVEKRHKEECDSLTVTSGHIPIQIPFLNIRYIEVYGHYLWVHTVNGSVRTRTSLSTIMTQLPSRLFIRCYRSYIVNLTHVHQLGDHDFLMSDGKHIPIAREKRGEACSRYMSYMFREMEAD